MGVAVAISQWRWVFLSGQRLADQSESMATAEPPVTSRFSLQAIIFYNKDDFAWAVNYRANFLGEIYFFP